MGHRRLKRKKTMLIVGLLQNKPTPFFCRFNTSWSQRTTPLQPEEEKESARKHTQGWGSCNFGLRRVFLFVYVSLGFQFQLGSEWLESRVKLWLSVYPHANTNHTLLSDASSLFHGIKWTCTRTHDSNAANTRYTHTQTHTQTVACSLTLDITEIHIH